MSGDPYEIVKYDPGLRNELLALQTFLWNPSPEVNAAYLEWKYDRNPWVREKHIYLALHQGKAVGMRGFYGSRWESGAPAQQRTILCGGDLVIAPEHRGGGLFTRIMAHAMADLASAGTPFLFNTSAGAVTRLGALTMGWKDIGPIPILRRLPTPPPSRHWPLLDRLRGLHVSNAPRVEPMADLVRRLGHDGRLRHVRDEAWFAWRFQNPLSTYRFVYLGRRRLRGYLVLQADAYAQGDRPLKIVDFEAESDQAAMAVLDTALRLGATDAITVWRPALPTPRQAALRLRGFSDENPSSFAESFSTILIRPVGQLTGPESWRMDGIDLLNAESWDLRQSYTDGC